MLYGTIFCTRSEDRFHVFMTERKTEEAAASVPARVALEEANRKVRKPRGGKN